jgi:N-methylhydantoinase B
MRYTAERTATNVLVVTLHDMAYGIWDAEGRVIAIPEGFPPRLISSTFPIRRVREKFAGQIRPGDIFLTNSPREGAVHLPDWVFIKPVFYEDELVFFTCMGTHVADNGGAQAGSHFLAFDSIAEGLNIPLIKVAENNVLREDLLELVLANNRLPEMMRREFASMVGSVNVAERRMIELLDKYGKDTVKTTLEEMIERTEKAVRAEITSWPDGTWYVEGQTDDDGRTMDQPLTVRCELTIKGSDLYFDFSQTDDEVPGMVNAYYQVTLSCVMCTTFLFLGSNLAAYHNEGSMRPIHVTTRKGTIVDCRPGALVAGAPAITGGLVCEVVLAALSEAMPAKAVSPYARLISPIIVGKDGDARGIYVYSTFCSAAGGGAVAGYDGYQCMCDMGTLGVVGKTDAEEEMARFPWEVEHYEFRTDSHGAGRWRGAPGIMWKATNNSGDCNLICGSSDGFSTQAKGQQGGGDTPLNKAHVDRGAETIEITHPHLGMQLKRGDRLVTLTGGGAGVGRPEDRDLRAVRDDVRNELVSLEMARDVYKVVIDPDTWEIDEAGTAELRKADR